MTKETRLEKALLVGAKLKSDKYDLDKSMDELEELVIAAGGQAVLRVKQELDRYSSSYFIGSGKVEELKSYIEEMEITTVVFNDELSGAQIRNLEKELDRKIVDRTNLILDIFARRARSREGKLQVKLAQLKYRLPRLIGFRDYLSREGGGIGTRGPGEQKLETDRRHILREINNIEKELKEAEENRLVTRSQRQASNLPIVALVGYTNVGKSTLLNKILSLDGEEDDSRDVFVKDMLFATLDTSLRRAKLPNGLDCLISDTVGFVSKLPTHLIEAFKGTLEEVKYADLILHVVDGSSDDLDIQIRTTNEILKSLEVEEKNIITVFNKMDRRNLEDLVYDFKDLDKRIFISALIEDDVKRLLELIEKELPQKFHKVRMFFSYNQQGTADYFINKYKADKIEFTNEGSIIEVVINNIDYNKYRDFIIEDLN